MYTHKEKEAKGPCVKHVKSHQVISCWITRRLWKLDYKLDVTQGRKYGGFKYELRCKYLISGKSTSSYVCGPNLQASRSRRRTSMTGINICMWTNLAS
jgi:hypothetical protein